MKPHNDVALPANVPRPGDDGGGDYLQGLPIPKLLLPSTFGGFVDLSHLGAARTIVYCYPITGIAGKALGDGWDEIPGVVAGAPEACNYQEQYGEFLNIGVEIFGLSTQTIEDQREMAARLNLPFELLSDAELTFCHALNLPMLEVNGVRFLKRLTFVVRGGKIEQAFYPVFSPDNGAERVIQWLKDHPIR
jgi:Peroxiredoxin